MKNYIIEALEYALQGVSETDQNIFENYKVREEVVVNVEENGSNSRVEEAQEGGNYLSTNKFTDPDDVSARKNEGDQETSEEEIEQPCATETFRRDVTRLVLTREGKKFVNTMLDHCYCRRSTELDLNDLYPIDNYKYADINLYKILNQSRYSYFDTEAELFDGEDERRTLLEYPLFKKNLDDIEWEYHLNEVEIMTPDQFEKAWRRIVRVSKRIDDSTSVNKTLTKNVLYWNDIKCAFTKNDELVVRFGTTTSDDELQLIHLLKPVWKVETLPFGRVKERPLFSQQDIKEWLITRNGKSEANSNDNRRSPRKGSKADRLRKSNSNNNSNNSDN